MNTALKLKIVMFVLFVGVLGLLPPVAQGYSGGIELVRLTGILYLPGQKDITRGVETFTVHANRKDWIFEVQKAQATRGDVWTGWDILRNIFPSALYFRGPKDLIDSLNKPDIAGKLVSVEGYVYVADGIMQVTAIRLEQ